MRNVITWTTAASTRRPWSIGASQSIGGGGVPLGGGRLRVEAGGAVGPHLVAPVEAERGCRAAGLDGGAPGGETPARRAAARRRRPQRRVGAAGPLGAHPAGAGGGAAFDDGHDVGATSAPAAWHAMALLAAPGAELADQVGVGAATRRPVARSPVASASLTRTWAPASKPSAPSVDDRQLAAHRG